VYSHWISFGPSAAAVSGSPVAYSAGLLGVGARRSSANESANVATARSNANTNDAGSFIALISVFDLVHNHADECGNQKDHDNKD
jgi:hypothetical protein